jgi:hypothetical protein
MGNLALTFSVLYLTVESCFINCRLGRIFHHYRIFLVLFWQVHHTILLGKRELNNDSLKNAYHDDRIVSDASAARAK